MSVPKLDVAKGAVWFYHSHVVDQAHAHDLVGLATELDSGYRLSEDEAKAVFQVAQRLS